MTDSQKDTTRTGERQRDVESLREAMENDGRCHPFTSMRLCALGWVTATGGGSYALTKSGLAALLGKPVVDSEVG